MVRPAIELCMLCLSIDSCSLSVSGIAFKLTLRVSSVVKSKSENSCKLRLGSVSVWVAAACRAVASSRVTAIPI